MAKRESRSPEIPWLAVSVVGVAGFEPAASSSRSQVAARATSAATRVACGRLSVGVRWRPPLAVAIVTHFVTQSWCVRGRLLAWTVTVTATMAGRLTAVREPRASMRARSYHASPGRCKASVLWIDLWMLWATGWSTVVKLWTNGAVEKWITMKTSAFAEPEASAVHKRNEVSTVQPVSSVIPATEHAR